MNTPGSGDAVTSRSRGQAAEERTLILLEGHGLRLIERNYQCRFGEIDLIMEDGQSIVFVEVRFRHSDRYGSAAETVDRRKQAKLIATASQFLRDRRLNRPSRFDIAALRPRGDGLEIEWIKNAFGTD